MYQPQFKVGEQVASWNSGLVYTVLAIHELDMCGSYAYTVRRCRGGNLYGPTRQIAESRLCKEQTH